MTDDLPGPSAHFTIQEDGRIKVNAPDVPGWPDYAQLKFATGGNMPEPQPELIVAVTISRRTVYRSLMHSPQTVNQEVLSSAISVPHLWPEDVRDDVLGLLKELCDKDYEQKARTDDEASGADDDRIREQVLAELEQMGWLSPEEAGARLAIAEENVPESMAHLLTVERTETELDPTQHPFRSLSVPGLTTRCELCGRAARSHTELLVTAAPRPIQDNPQG